MYIRASRNLSSSAGKEDRQKANGETRVCAIIFSLPQILRWQQKADVPLILIHCLSWEGQVHLPLGEKKIFLFQSKNKNVCLEWKGDSKL